MTSQPSQLPRVLGPWMAIAIVVGTVIGTGVFKKGSNVAANVEGFWLAASVWVLGGILALLGSLTLAEVAVRYPRAGGNYVFLREAYGRPFGFLWGWVDFWIIRTGSIAALATMFTESLHVIIKELAKSPDELIGFWPRQFITCGLIAGLAIINALGTRIGGTLQLVVTILKVGSIISIVLLPFVIVIFFSNHVPMPTTANMAPFWPSDWSMFDLGKYGVAVVAVLWAYHGWMNIGPVAEEIKNPSRNIPIALVGGVLLLIALYVSANVAYFSAIPRDQMAKLTDIPVATEFCLRLVGPIGAIIASLILMTSVFGSLNGNILVGPRLLLAMGQDNLAPKSFSHIDPRTHTPVIATAIVAGWSCLLVLILGLLLQFAEWLFHTGKTTAAGLPEVKSPFDALTDFAVFGSATFETLAVASIFAFRIKNRDVTPTLPYRCIGYPVVPILYVMIMLAVLTNMLVSPNQRTEALIGFGFIAVGTVVYYVYTSCGSGKMAK